MGPIDGTLMIAGSALALAAVAVGFGIGAVINMQRMKATLGAYARDLLHEENERLRQELAITLNNQDGKFEVAITTARQARDAVNSTAGIVDGLQHRMSDLVQLIAKVGIDLADADKRHEDRNAALLAEIAGPLQGVQQRANNLEHDVRNLEQSVLVLATRGDQESAPSRDVDQRQAEAGPADASPPANEIDSTAAALVVDTQAETTRPQAPPTSPPAPVSDDGVKLYGGEAGGSMEASPLDDDRMFRLPSWLRPKPQTDAVSEPPAIREDHAGNGAKIVLDPPAQSNALPAWKW